MDTPRPERLTHDLAQAMLAAGLEPHGMTVIDAALALTPWLGERLAAAEQRCAIAQREGAERGRRELAAEMLGDFQHQLATVGVDVQGVQDVRQIGVEAHVEGLLGGTALAVAEGAVRVEVRSRPCVRVRVAARGELGQRLHVASRSAVEEPGAVRVRCAERHADLAAAGAHGRWGLHRDAHH